MLTKKEAFNEDRWKLIHATLDCNNILIVAYCLGLRDIVHRQSNDNIDKLLAFLKKIDAIHRRPHDKILEPKKRSRDPKDLQRPPVLEETLRQSSAKEDWD